MDSFHMSKPQDISEAWWKEICKRVKHAIIYIDDFIVESLHWSGGLDRLLKNGCKDVRSFSDEVYSKSTDEKAVFLISGSITGSVFNTLKKIIQSSSLKYVIVVTGAHSSVHSFSTLRRQENEEKDVMTKLEETILGWLHNVTYTVEIFYYPVFLVCPMDNLFLMPKFSEIAPIFEDEIPNITKNYFFFNRSDKRPISTLDELEFHHLPFPMQESIFHFISTIHSLLQGVNAREEIYFMGNLARIIAGELDTYLPARQRRKTAMNKVSLVLLDRSLDLVSPAEYGSSILMSRILSLLSRFPGHKIDSAINLSSLSSIHSSAEWTLLPGCFAHPTEPVSSEVFKSLTVANKKDSIIKLNEEVKNIVKSSKNEDHCGEVSSLEELEKNVWTLSKQEETFEKYFHLIQQSLGIIEALKHERTSHLDQLYGVQKMLLQMLNDPQSETSPFYEVIQLLKNREKKDVSLEEILSLLVYLCSLGGFPIFKDTFDYDVTNPLSQAFGEGEEGKGSILDTIFKEEIDEVSALKASKNVWKRLISISRARAHLKDYRDLYTRESKAEPFTYRNLLSRVLEDCLNPTQHQITDLECKSAGFKDLIKTGFSLFVNVSKPRPKDAAQMIIYIFGGITPAEVAEVERLVQIYQPSCEVLIGSSHLTYPQDITQQCFKNIS